MNMIIFDNIDIKRNVFVKIVMVFLGVWYIGL